MEKYIIHIPHSALKTPRIFRKRLLVDKNYFEKENIFISDYLVDKFIPKDFSNIVKFNYSRMFCDVERYLDDNLEEMSKYGMGAIYEKDSNKKEYLIIDDNYKKYVINYYYKRHHRKLDEMVEKVLKEYKTCFIVDLHSFSDEFVLKMFNITNNPDICIGINNNYDHNLLEMTKTHFTRYGYSVKVNYPYSGSIISNKYPEVKSIMIEINKRIYSNNNKFNKLATCMTEYFKLLDNKK